MNNKNNISSRNEYIDYTGSINPDEFTTLKGGSQESANITSDRKRDFLKFMFLRVYQAFENDSNEIKLMAMRLWNNQS